MAKAIHDLPNEILVEVFHQLNPETLKEARLTCSLWAELGARWLFQRLFFAPHRQLMDLFSYVTSNPRFAVGVTELVYDGRLFWGHWARLDQYGGVYMAALESIEWDEEKSTYDSIYELVADWGSRMYRPDGRVFDKREAAKSHARYVAFFEQQKEVLDIGADFQLLCQGLQRLPNLRAISFNSTFDEPPDVIDVDAPTSLWYGKWSSRIWQDTLPPTSWRLCEQMAAEAADRDNEELETALDKNPWDWRGLIYFIHAVGLHKPGISRLDFGTPMSKIPLELLQSSFVTSSLMAIAPNLQCLKLGALISEEVLEEPLPAKHNGIISSLGDILQQASNLTILSSSTYVRQNIWWPTFGRLHWHQLTVLELIDQPASILAFKAIFQRHKDTLVELTLRNMHLDIESSTETWEEVGKECKGMLKLRCLRLEKLASYVYTNNGNQTPFLNREGVVGVGYDLVSWIPEDKLLIDIEDEEDGLVIFRHADHWVEGPELLEPERES